MSSNTRSRPRTRISPAPTTPQALVTGGSGTLGAAICRQLAAQGCQVWIHAHRHLDQAQALAEQIQAGGGKAGVVQFDLGDGEACRQRLEPLLQSQPIQVLVHNAGIHDDAAFPAMRWDQWQRVIDVHLSGFFHVTQALLMPMIASRWGRIVTVSSVSAQAGNRGQTNYAAAKSALHGASKSLALEVAQRGITVNVVAPGVIESAMTEGLFSADEIARMVPMQRAGQAQEVADLVGFLASPRASYITGQVIGINGGLYS